MEENESNANNVTPSEQGTKITPDSSGTSKKVIPIKLFVIAFAILLLVTGIAIGTYFIVNNVKKSDSNSNTTSSGKTPAEVDKNSAIDAENKNDYAKALEYYEKAKSDYQKDNNTNGVVDMEAKIFLMKQKLNQ